MDISRQFVSSDSSTQLVMVSRSSHHVNSILTDLRMPSFVDNLVKKDESIAMKMIGLDWDDSTRGKHSGYYNGIHYFISR